MREELFAELLESVRQGGAILRGQAKPSRAYRFEEVDVRAVREGYGLSQNKFAALMGISPATLRNWEQGRRKPEGSARVLLQVVARHPEAVLEAVSGASNKRLERTGGKAPRRKAS
jgi:putative transcriptional regulator